MLNLDLYERGREVPEEAQKPITAGRLKGMTDINPMWRIKKLTELFGPCGIGWAYEIKNQWMEPGANNEVSAFVNIELYIRQDGEWSRGIPGNGGSKYVSSETKGLYTDDECYKKALTDALSVACKAIGIGADVYFKNDRERTKHSAPPESPTNDPMETPHPENKSTVLCSKCGREIKGVKLDNSVMKSSDVVDLGIEKFGKPLCYRCQWEASK